MKKILFSVNTITITLILISLTVGLVMYINIKADMAMTVMFQIIGLVGILLHRLAYYIASVGYKFLFLLSCGNPRLSEVKPEEVGVFSARLIGYFLVLVQILYLFAV